MELKVDNAAVEKLVNEQIRIAVAEQLNKNTDYLIQRIVDEALKQPERGSYNHEPQIQRIIRDMIQKAANESVQEWLNEKKPEIKKMVYAQLSKSKTGLVAQIAEALVVQLGKGLNVNVWFSEKDGR